MLAIRFNRTGKKNHASFRIVLQEHTKAPGKRHVEILGSYDPHKKVAILKKERIGYWIGQGAQTSPVVTNLLIREGVIERKKVAKKMPRPVIKEDPASEVVVAEEPIKGEDKGEESVDETSIPPVASGIEQTEVSASEEKKETAAVAADAETSPAVEKTLSV